LQDPIFQNFAPSYWAAGLPVIPLRQKNKMPDINQWSMFGSRMPTDIEMQHWLHSFPKGNIGLPFGPTSGLCAIDIDTEDQDLVNAILDILPKTPWVRIGKKGMGLAYKFEGQKNFKLRGADGGMIMEFLGLGNQMVMPPSIHPDTQLPYTANTNLWEVLDKIPYLGEDIEEKLRALLGSKGFEIGAGGRSSPVDIVPAGERDVQMIRHAGYLARVVLGIDKSARFSLWDAVLHMHTWVEQFTAKVSGDAMDPEKGVSKLLEFLVKDLEKGRTLPEGWDADLTDELRAHPIIVKISELSSGRSWTVDEARGWFDERVRSSDGSMEAISRAIGEVTELVARDTNFGKVKADMLFGYIRERYLKGQGVTKRDLTSEVDKLRRGLANDEPENQALIAAAVLEDMQKFGEIRYDHGQFWQWNGSCFQKLDADTLYMHVANNVKDSMLVRRHSDYAAIVQVLERMCKGELLQVEDRGINFANGFVGEDLFIADHDPKFGATFTLPFIYDRDNATRCPKWMEFLHSCWGHEPDFDQRVLALQEMFAATLFGVATQYQRAFLLFGRAGTGKTQLLNVLRAMLPPDAVSNLGPDKWGERFTLTDLIGKSANICGELPENGMVTGNVFKEVVEGSPQRTEFKGQDGFVFVPKAANWFASNYLPVSRDTTRGFIRRWLILDFNKPVREEDKTEGLADMIVAEEREAIAAWSLEGLRRLLDQRGYTLPPCHEKRQAQMRRINNSVQAFLEDHSGIALDAEGEIKTQELYDIYVQHIQNYRRGTAVSFERFMQMLEDLDLGLDRDAIGDYIVKGVAKAAA